MARFFEDNGLRAIAVHSGETSAPRATSLEQLRLGNLDIVFAVDMFNEGLDLPEVDTVVMLRPPESPVIWLQQFGRGLRCAEGKSNLSVVDYIGNHRVFLTKVRALLACDEGDRALTLAIDSVRRGEVDLPPGCEITYELEAIDILKKLLRATDAGDAIEAFYSDFRFRHGNRPTALEIYHAGFNPRTTGHGQWLNFVAHMGDLDEREMAAYQKHRSFFDSVSITPMSKSYKMLVLEAMLAEQALPGRISIEALTARFSLIASRNPKFRADVTVQLDDLAGVRRLLVDNPVAAWVEGRGTGGQSYFKYEDGSFETSFSVGDEVISSFRKLADEIVTWRTAEYLDRSEDEHGSSPTLRDDLQEGGRNESGPGNKSELWREYMREDIPPLFDTVFSSGRWNSGIILNSRDMILLVTLKKDNLTAESQYENLFFDPSTFNSQSHIQTTPT